MGEGTDMETETVIKKQRKGRKVKREPLFTHTIAALRFHLVY